MRLCRKNIYIFIYLFLFLFLFNGSITRPRQNLRSIIALKTVEHLFFKLLPETIALRTYSGIKKKTVYQAIPSSQVLKYLWNIVSVLWREEGYTVKYSLTLRKIPRADAKGFPEGSGYISQHIPNWVTIRTFSFT